MSGEQEPVVILVKRMQINVDMIIIIELSAHIIVLN